MVGVERRLVASFGVRLEAYHRRFDRLLVQRLESDIERAARLVNYEIPPDLPPDSVFLEHRPTIYPESTGRGRPGARGSAPTRRSARRAVAWLHAEQVDSRAVWLHSAVRLDRRHAVSATGPWEISDRLDVPARGGERLAIH